MVSSRAARRAALLAAVAAAITGPLAAAEPTAATTPAVAPDLDAAVKSSIAAYSLVELAAGCGWISGATDVGQARTSALAFAMSGMPVEQKALVLARLFADDEKLLVRATSDAQARVRMGECGSREARQTWIEFGAWLEMSAKAAKPATDAVAPPKPGPAIASPTPAQD